MDNQLFIPICISELISLILIFKLWQKDDYLILKLLTTLVTLAPFVGPLFYLFGTNHPPKQPLDMQDKPHSTDYVDRGWRANYSGWWQNEKPRLQKKIDDLKKKT